MRALALIVFWTALTLSWPTNTFAAEPAQDVHETPSNNIIPRSTFAHCKQKFEQGTGRVAFMGGSITEGGGYRVLMGKFLEEKFPKTKFTFINAGIASTCSTTGAFRLSEDVLSQGPIDLLFVEFAVNDDQDAHHELRESRRGMEGIIRQALQANPQMEIVCTFFVNPEMLALVQQGKTPLAIAAHSEVVQHYGISSINVVQEVADRIAAGTLTWDQYGGTHPAPAGHAFVAGLMQDLLTTAWKSPAGPARATLPKSLDEKCYERGRFLPWDAVQLGADWKLGKVDWKSIPGNCRDRFLDLKFLSGEVPGAEVTVKFQGTALGAYVLAGPDAGRVKVSIDGGPFKTVELYHGYSGGLHYPRTVMFDADLTAGEHTARLIISAENHANSKGHAVRIVRLTGN